MNEQPVIKDGDFAESKEMQIQSDTECEENMMNTDGDELVIAEDRDINTLNNREDQSNLYGIHCFSELIDRLNTEDLKYGRDNGQYLIFNARRILNDEFEPTFIDLLQCHVRSTGLMFENHVMCRSLPIATYNKDSESQEKQDIVFRVVDVGGHRNERKKWNFVLQQENDVIVFVVSAASFCQVLFEDFKKNAMRESLDVWENIISNHKQTEETQFILVINKMDLFYQRYHLFHEYFPEYDGDERDKYEILDYIKSLYLNIAKKYNQTNIHCVCTKLTDSLEIATFDIQQIKHILLNYECREEDILSSMNHKHVHDMLNEDIVDIIIDYAIGDVFWSEKWLIPMWERKMKQQLDQNKLIPPSETHKPKKYKRKYQRNTLNDVDNVSPCDHVTNPHDYRIEYKLQKKKSLKSRQSLSRKLSQIFQSKQEL